MVDTTFFKGTRNCVLLTKLFKELTVHVSYKDVMNLVNTSPELHWKVKLSLCFS